MRTSLCTSTRLGARTRILGGFDGTSWERTDAAAFVGAGSVVVSRSDVSDVVLDVLIIQSASSGSLDSFGGW